MLVTSSFQVSTLLVLLASLVLGAFGAWFMSRYAYRFGLVDVPNDRSSHDLPTPRGGGIGILAAFALSSALLGLPLSLWLPAVCLALVSFFDDRLDLSPRTRLVCQFLAAAFVGLYVLGGPEGFIIQHPTSTIQNCFLLLFFAVVMTGTANFYNFMDGINGIAAITGAVGFALLALFAQRSAGAPGIAVSSLCLSAACAGFLPFNIPRARVFMGDVGSVLLGFVFAAYVALLARSAADFLVLAGCLSTFYADGLTTLWIRRRDGERLSQAHRRHLYQLFCNQKRAPHWKVSLVYGALQGGVGLLLMAVRPSGLAAVAALELCLLAGWWAVMAKVRREVEGQF